jgi:hypothetical protein
MKTTTARTGPTTALAIHPLGGAGTGFGIGITTKLGEGPKVKFSEGVGLDVDVGWEIGV